MYRLLKRYTLPVHNLQFASVHNNLQQTSQVCSFCSFYHFKPIKSRPCVLVHRRDVLRNSDHSILRRQSTSTITAFLDERESKKIKHKIQKYAELLEVSHETTMNRTATVKKLNATSVSNFANQPEISLDQLHKIRDSKKLPNQETSGNNAEQSIQQTKSMHSSDLETERDANSIGSFSSYGWGKQDSLLEDEISMEDDLMTLGSEDQITMIKNASVLNTLQEYSENITKDSYPAGTAASTSKVMEQKKKKSVLRAEQQSTAAKLQMDELQRQGKQESLKRSLHSYLDVCIYSGMISQGFSALMYYRNRGKRAVGVPRISDVSLHNTMLHGFASVGNLVKVKEILQILAEDSIKPNPQTYAAVFECIGRITSGKNHRDFLKTIHSDMKRHGITANDILDKSMFLHDQRAMVEKGIRLTKPKFKVRYTRPNTSYTNHLLNKITSTPSKLTSPAEGIFTTSELRERGHRQMKLESQCQVTVKSIASQAEPTAIIISCREKVIQHEQLWKGVILESLRRDVAALKSQYSNGSHLQRSINIYPYLKVLDEHHYVDAIANETRRLATGSETFSPSLNFLARDLGLSIFHRYQIELKTRHGVREKVSGIYEKYCNQYLNGFFGQNTRTLWQNLLHEERHNGPTADVDMIQWPSTILSSVGRFLYNILMRDIKIDVNCVRRHNKTERYLPAFYTVFRNNRHTITQEVKPHPILSRLYKDAQLETLTFEPAQLPSLSPPVPWYTIRNGGYLISEAKIIRLPFQAVQQWQRLDNVPQQQLYPILDSLNQLGSIPWKVNNPVLDIALQIFQNGGSKVLDIPEPPSHLPPPILVDVNASKEERNKAAKARLKEKRKKADMYSLWCEALYRLSLANHFRGDVFWLPHSIDFRGRVYPIPPHVNHLGSDLARSLMVFALGKPLGPNGLDWLKIHIINLTGLKKRESNDERLRYANELLPKIIDSAENPLTGEMWWQESEEPWQTLAASLEIAEALKSPNPADFVSRFPIHQDGSCNGLQHYAALGRDQQGAESVNLSPAPKPQDVYSAIVALVEKERKNDADAGVPIARTLDGIIKRKVIKQTVMTTVYGVTRFGARLQIARQLKEIEFPEEFLWQGSHYLVNKTFHSLREMFTSTKLIQDWLTDCARLVALIRAQNMEWITPLGLPVVQPYNKSIQRVEGITPVQHFAMDMFERPNVMKQKNAFPPNFIHSLDSSHMMLTSLHCEHAGLTFVSVHDCFWTHACSVSEMNQICREEFVALHSEPILENLSKFLIENFSYGESELYDDGSVTQLTKRKLNTLLAQVPKQGAFDLNYVLKSVYFFS